jgi:hypothetical protein
LYISPGTISPFLHDVFGWAVEYQAGEPTVIDKHYFTRQVTILLNFAKATKDPKVAAGLIEKAADLKLRVDEPGARPDQSPSAPDVEPEK